MHCSGVHHGAPEITCKYWDRLKMFAMVWLKRLARDKHSSLFICNKNALRTIVEHIVALLTLPVNILGLPWQNALAYSSLTNTKMDIYKSILCPTLE
jgi:hypothetical protein